MIRNDTTVEAMADWLGTTIIIEVKHNRTEKNIF